jgi:hypothetical protein
MLGAMAATDGRVPLRLRLGVTGHRVLEDERSIATKVDEVIARIWRLASSSPDAPVPLEVVSPLGEGADRLVAERVLAQPDAVLEAPLPLPRSDYELDFGSEASRARFGELVERADLVWVIGQAGDRVEAYRTAGEYIVDSCDVLIAVWDGEPSRGRGGTRDILDVAHGRDMPTFVIGAHAPFEISEICLPPSFGVVEDAARYERTNAPARRQAATRVMSRSVELAGPEGAALARCLDWVERPFRRAEAVASRARRRFLLTSRSLFLMSALATLAIALSVGAGNDDDAASAFAALEVALMIAAVGLWLIVRRRIHDRWITARFLAERLRGSAFLAFVGSRDDVGSRPAGDYRASGQEWVTRLFREVWRTRPRLDPAGRDPAAIADLVRTGWLDPQVAYYERRGEGHAKAFAVLTGASVVLFAGAISAAAIHAFGSSHETSGVVVVLSIALPAFAGALLGLSALEEHARHAERFALMARRLQELGDRLTDADDLPSIRALTLAIEAELRTEGDAWVDVMRFRDVELPA